VKKIAYVIGLIFVIGRHWSQEEAQTPRVRIGPNENGGREAVHTFNVLDQ